MPATITFKVSGISPVGDNQANVAFTVTAVIAGGGTFSLNVANLIFPRAEGKEFELDDEYSLTVAPKPEGEH